MLSRHLFLFLSRKHPDTVSGLFEHIFLKRLSYPFCCCLIHLNIKQYRISIQHWAAKGVNLFPVALNIPESQFFQSLTFGTYYKNIWWSNVTLTLVFKRMRQCPHPVMSCIASKDNRFFHLKAPFRLPLGSQAVALSGTEDVGAHFFLANGYYPKSWWGNSSI